MALGAIYAGSEEWIPCAAVGRERGHQQPLLGGVDAAHVHFQPAIVLHGHRREHDPALLQAEMLEAIGQGGGG